MPKKKFEAQVDILNASQPEPPARAADLLELMAENQSLKAELDDLKLLYEATIEHGEAVEDQLAEKNILLQAVQTRLDDAINTISEGFCLFGPDDALVVANSQYKALLSPSDEAPLEPGRTFEEILRAAIDQNLITDAMTDPEAWIAQRLERHRTMSAPFVERYESGRWCLVNERPTQDGGVVAVYSDITRLKDREKELADKTIQLEQLSKQLAKYLSPQVYDSIFQGRQEVKIASTRKKLTVFFSDIAGFTETADRLESEELTNLLNHYLTEMSRIALTYGATIDKFVGDAIVIFFGDPETRGVKTDALACVEMAIAMQKRMGELEDIWLSSGISRPLKCRVGIHTDYCTVGNFGSEDRLDYTIIGRGVNTAARLEALANPGHIIISYETYLQVRDTIACRKAGDVAVKGIAYPVSTYEVIGKKDALEPIEELDVLAMSQKLKDLAFTDNNSLSADERQHLVSSLKSALDKFNQKD